MERGVEGMNLSRGQDELTNVFLDPALDRGGGVGPLTRGVLWSGVGLSGDIWRGMKKCSWGDVLGSGHNSERSKLLQWENNIIMINYSRY